MAKDQSKAELSLAADLEGRLIGTLTRDSGAIGIEKASLRISGNNPLGKWTRNATSGANGYFECELPFHSEGAIKVDASFGTESLSAKFEAGDLSQAQTPASNKKSDALSLEGTWEFMPDPPKDFLAKAEQIDWKSIVLPRHWEMEGFLAESGKALYRKSIEIPRKWQGKRIKFRADGIFSQCEVWWNGKRIGGHQGGATPFELDFTSGARWDGKNELLILVCDSSDAGDLDAMSYYAHMNLAGIWRPIQLFCVEPVHVSRAMIKADYEASSGGAGILKIAAEIANEQAVSGKGKIRFRLYDREGKEVALESPVQEFDAAAWDKAKVDFHSAVANSKPWNAELPYLYQLIIEVESKGQGKARLEYPIGFRTVEIQGRAYTINGQPVKLWGACRHDSDPLLGRAITSEIARKDADLMKGANLNSFRTSHYPPHPAAIACADELGLYVEDEGPFCFAGVSYGPVKGRDHDITNDLRLLPLAISLTSQFIERDRNHPSVVIWSQCNESSYGRVFQEVGKYIKRIDPSRPISAGQSANPDIATYHNPTSMQRMKDTADFKMPVLFDEGMAIFQGHGPMNYRIDLDPGLRDFWVTAHPQVVDAIIASEHQFGAQIWAWADDAFLMPRRGIEYGRRNLTKNWMVDSVYKMPGRGILGDPMWGIIESWRQRPRPEWWLCKKLFSPIRIEEKPVRLEKSGEFVVPVRNLNRFINLSEYACKWSIGKEKGSAKLDVAAMSAGTIRIRTRKSPSPDSTLSLMFYDWRGELVDGFLLPLKEREIEALPNSGSPARIAEEGWNLNFASTVRLIGRDGTELAYDRPSGQLARGLAKGEVVLTAGPRLHIMKSWATTEVCPANWVFKKASYRQEKNWAVLEWEGAFSDFEGGYTIRMDDAGDCWIDYRFVYSGPGMTAHEIGLEFELYPNVNRLEWDRKAEWSFYPEDHIGRPKGWAVPHPNVAQTVPPGDCPFGLDDHFLGCNDFRSAKRNIYTASMMDERGAGIRIVSEGTQHVRATLAAHSVLLKVLDYYGGTATGAGEWDGAYGMGKEIKTGDVVSGGVRFQLLHK